MMGRKIIEQNQGLSWRDWPIVSLALNLMLARLYFYMI